MTKNHTSYMYQHVHYTGIPFILYAIVPRFLSVTSYLRISTVCESCSYVVGHNLLFLLISVFLSAICEWRKWIRYMCTSFVIDVVFLPVRRQHSCTTTTVWPQNAITGTKFGCSMRRLQPSPSTPALSHLPSISSTHVHISPRHPNVCRWCYHVARKRPLSL